MRLFNILGWLALANFAAYGFWKLLLQSICNMRGHRWACTAKGHRCRICGYSIEVQE